MQQPPIRETERLQRALFVPLTILAWLAVGIVVFWLLGHVTHALVVIVLALVLAYALAPLVSLLRRFVSRPLAVGVAYLISLAIVVGLGTLLVITAASQVVNLVSNLPAYAQRVKDLGPQVVTLLGPLGVTEANLQALNQQALAEVQAVGAAVAASSLAWLSSLAGKLVDAALILILSIYLTLAGPRAVRALKAETTGRTRGYVSFFLEVANQVAGGYVRGTLTMALLVGVLVGLGLAVLGVPYAVLLGVVAFFMEFVPVVGVLISGAISLLVSIPRGMGVTVIVLVYFVIVHILEGDVIGPRIMGRAVGIHPATGIIALLVGTELFGVWGALFGAPLAGLLQAVITGIWLQRRREAAQAAAAANAAKATAATTATQTDVARAESPD